LAGVSVLTSEPAAPVEFLMLRVVPLVIRRNAQPVEMLDKLAIVPLDRILEEAF